MASTPGPSSGRSLVLCFDGTLSKFTSSGSNIVRLYSFLEKNQPDKQLVYYQPGIGTYVTKPASLGPIINGVYELWDAAFATSLDDHVMSGYKFLMKNWREGDRISLFGWSRGSYTARALSGMLYHVGLLPKDNIEEVAFAYEIYRNQVESSEYKRDFCRTVSIEFIGVYDTVESVGFMIPRTLPFPSNNHMVKRFRHALALDESRAPFTPLPWVRDTYGEPPTGNRVLGGLLENFFSFPWKQSKKVYNMVVESAQGLPRRGGDGGPEVMGKGTDVKEVWFVGGHANVGGSAAKNSEPFSLENITLRWMMKEVLEALDSGILFNDEDDRIARLGIVLNPPKADRAANGNGYHHRPPSSPEPYPGYGPYQDTEGGEREPDDFPSPYCPEDIRHGDVVAPILDSSKSLLWAPFQLFPFIRAWQDKNDRWHSAVVVNFGQARKIQEAPAPSSPSSALNPDPRGAEITPAPTLWHVSVQARMESPDAAKRSWKTLWTKAEMYRPRAQMRGSGSPVFVR